jgi:hypothetical protein
MLNRGAARWPEQRGLKSFKHPANAPNPRIRGEAPGLHVHNSPVSWRFAFTLLVVFAQRTHPERAPRVLAGSRAGPCDASRNTPRPPRLTHARSCLHAADHRKLAAAIACVTSAQGLAPVALVP